MNKSAGKIVLVLLFVAIIVTGIQSCGKRKENMQASIASKILRFHILANSDVEKDQEVKEKVRDALDAKGDVAKEVTIPENMESYLMRKLYVRVDDSVWLYYENPELQLSESGL